MNYIDTEYNVYLDHKECEICAHTNDEASMILCDMCEKMGSLPDKRKNFRSSVRSKKNFTKSPKKILQKDLLVKF